MKIVYMGTPDFAVPPLIKMKEAGYNVALVVTQPDRPRDRGKKIQPTPVKTRALEYGLPVFQPEKPEEFQELIRRLKEIAPDIIVVAAYGKILSKDILDLPPLGCINIHASLLPRFRGAAPIQHSILSGDKETGITMMYMSAGMDEGDIIAKKATPINRKTGGELFQELSVMGGELLIETLEQIVGGKAKSWPQDHSLATYAPKITKEDSKLDFNMKAIDLERLIRAMNPLPGAYTNYQEQTMKVFDGEVLKSRLSQQPGTIKQVDDSGILVATGEDDILIKKIRMPGKQTMEVSEYIKGNKIEIGSVLG